MIRLGCNYSEALLELLDETIDCFDYKVDYIKIGAFAEGLPELERCYTYAPLLLHGFGWFERLGMTLTEKRLGSTLELAEDMERINCLVARYQSPHIGVHALMYEQDVTSETAVLERMLKTATYFKEQLDVPLLMENMDYSPYYQKELQRQSTLPVTVQPAFISQLIQQADMGLLLDLAHAKVSAYHLNQSVTDYLAGLPLDKVLEVHVSSSQQHPDYGQVDVHEVLTEEDYQLLIWLLKRCQPQIITLEYGWPGDNGRQKTDKAAIAYQLKRLNQIIN